MTLKKLKQILLALVLVLLLSGVLLEGISISSYLTYRSQPSATQQLLVFAGVPPDTVLPSEDGQIAGDYSSSAFNTDYRPVEAILLQRYPLGTSRQGIEQYLNTQTCNIVNDEKIVCSFHGLWYPKNSPSLFSPIRLLYGCSETVDLILSFDTSNRLSGIEINGGTNCL